MFVYYRPYGPLWAWACSGEFFYEIFEPYAIFGRKARLRKSSICKGQLNTESHGPMSVPRVGFELTIPVF